MRVSDFLRPVYTMPVRYHFGYENNSYDITHVVSDFVKNGRRSSQSSVKVSFDNLKFLIHSSNMTTLSRKFCHHLPVLPGLVQNRFGLRFFLFFFAPFWELVTETEASKFNNSFFRLLYCAIVCKISTILTCKSAAMVWIWLWLRAIFENRRIIIRALFGEKQRYQKQKKIMQITLDLIAFALELKANWNRFGVTPVWAVYTMPLPRRHQIEPVWLPNWVFTPFMPASYRTRVNG